MATPSPKANPRSTTITVAVVGLTTSSYLGEQGEGAGKSCLCNRFVWPHADHYYNNHPYIVNYSEFGNSVINNTHFLYWGEKTTSLEDTSEVCFRIIEHTEFVEDMSLKPFPVQKPYHKRITVTKLQSGGKVQYVAPNQLTLPEEYTSVTRFPDRSVQIDGFVLCIDAASPFSPGDIQYDVAFRLITSLQSTKKPFVVALTKCDKADTGSVSSITELLNKLKKVPPIIEVSSHEGVNIDLCFLYLSHLIDSRKSKSRIVSYEEAYSVIKARIKKNEASFNIALSHKLTDFTMPIARAVELMMLEPEWHGVAQLKGKERCTRLVKLRLADLLGEEVKKQAKIFLELLPEYLRYLLPEVTLTDTYETSMTLLRQHPEFSDHVIEKNDWENDNEFIFSFSRKIPISLLEKEGKQCVVEYIESLQLQQRKELAIVHVKQVLEKTNDLQPGLKVMSAMEHLGLTDEANLIPSDILQKMYTERMTVVEQKCSDDIHELLLERLDLFHEYTPDTKEIIEKLQDEPRLKVMELASTRRDGIIVKHISNLEVLKRGPYFTPEIIPRLGSDCPSLDALRSTHEENWLLDEDSTRFNMAILGVDSDTTLTLRSDIMNLCSGADIYEANNKCYELNMMCFHGDITSLAQETFIPQGSILVVNSMEGLEWMGSFVSKHFLSTSSNSQLKYHGLPSVLLVVDEDMFDGKSTSELYTQSKQLATQLQCVLVCTRPCELPGRLVNQDIVNNTLQSLFDAVSLTSRFLTIGPKLDEDGLNFGVFLLPGDPINHHALSTGLCSQQLVHFDEDKRLLYMKLALERQHKVATFSFYSTINAKDFSTHPMLGFIVLYSSQRKASLAAVKWLIPRLHDIPILLVAMTTDNPSSLVKEGEQFCANLKKGSFVTFRDQIPITEISEFCSKCFFSRFTSWKSQRLSNEVITRLLKRKVRELPRACPDLPTDYSSNTLPHSFSRHSIAVGLEDHPQIARGKDNFFTMSRPPTKGQYPQPDEDDPMYTSPADIKKTQANLCPNRGASLKHFSPNHQGMRGGGGGNRKSSVPDLSPVTPQHAQSAPTGGVLDYVLIPNTNTLNKLDTLTRLSQAPRFSPPSSPEEEEDVTELYASPRDIGSPMKKKDYDHLPIQSPRQSPPPIPAREKLYDHLTPRSRRKLIQQQQKGIDIADANRLANGGMYSLADTNGMQEGIYCLAGDEHPVVSDTNQSIGVYSIATEILPQSNVPIGIYDLAQDTIIRSNSHSNNTSRGGNHHQVQGSSRGSSATSPTTEMYSYATVRSNTPDDNLYAEARNPHEWYRSPSPPRALSPLAIHSSPSPPRTQKPIKPPKPVKPDQSKRNGQRKSPPSAKSSVIPHVQPTDNPDLLYATPNKPTPSSPQVVHIQHVVPNDENPDNIYAIPHSGSFKGKSVSSREATPNTDFDDEDEEAPPLPERNYNWSDIEDEDDDILYSDDEDDHDHYPGFHPIGVYATVTEAKGQAKTTQLNTPQSAVRCSVEVGEMESVYMNLNQLRKQLGKAAPEESIYDTLEKVVAAAKSPTTTTLPSITMNATSTLPPLSKKALKLMQKMEKKAAREAERRKKQDARRKKKQEEEMKKMEKALKKGKKYKAKTQRKRYFESSLSSIVDPDGIPALVKSCAAIIERDGLESEGVYRVSGKKEDIMAVQEKYDQDPSIDLENLNMCINAVSGVMKAFFKLLPDPLIPESLLPALLDIPGQSLEAQKEKMHNQLSKLPRENLKTLSFLANHLYKVQLYQETNKMSASNLSIVFWPTLMRPPLKDLADPGKQLGFQLTMAKIIENPDFVPDIN